MNAAFECTLIVLRSILSPLKRRDNDPTYGPKFGHAGALTLNLKAPGLAAAASALAPGILRIGGTPADGIVYEVRGGECASVPNKPEPTCLPNKGYSCDKCGDKYGCLTFDRWRELLLFANTTGMRLVFGLNGCRGRRSAGSEMDWSNIVDLLNRTVAEGLGPLVTGFELGNELIKGYVTPEQMAKVSLRSDQFRSILNLPTLSYIYTSQNACFHFLIKDIRGGHNLILICLGLYIPAQYHILVVGSCGPNASVPRGRRRNPQHGRVFEPPAQHSAHCCHISSVWFLWSRPGPSPLFPQRVGAGFCAATCVPVSGE